MEEKFWTTRPGIRIPYTQLANSHLWNIIHMLQDQIEKLEKERVECEHAGFFPMVADIETKLAEKRELLGDLWAEKERRKQQGILVVEEGNYYYSMEYAKQFLKEEICNACKLEYLTIPIILKPEKKEEQ